MPFKKFGLSVLILLIGIVVGYLVYFFHQSSQSCIGVVTLARNIFTSKCEFFSSPCSVPPIFYEEDSWCPNDPPSLMSQ